MQYNVPSRDGNKTHKEEGPMNSTLKKIAAASLCAGLAAAGAVHGQQYPSKPVRVIVRISSPSIWASNSSWTTAAARAG
jgi:hypothetical protein